MFRVWLTRRWLLVTAVALLFGAVCYLLGTWQWGRYVDKRTKATAIETHYDAAPVPLGHAFAPSLGPEQQWTRVSFTATYVGEPDLMVRNRTLDKTVGFEVLSPARTEVGTILLDRGWVPNAREADATPPADPPPSGEVQVTGWLRTMEVDLDRELPAPQMASINLRDARRLAPELLDAEVYVVVGEHSPAAVAGSAPVTPMPRPDADLGPHQAYAIQWWVTMPAGLAFVVFAVRREAALARQEDGEAVVRAKKVRIWDEEDA